MATGNVQDPMALLGKYKAGFTGAVPKEFSKNGELQIKSALSGEDKGKQLYGYNTPASHPTPTDPHGGRK